MSVKPLARWATFQQWTLRYTDRNERGVRGIFTTPDGPVVFRYDRHERTIYLPDRSVRLDEHGWEVDASGQTRFTSTRASDVGGSEQGRAEQKPVANHPGDVDDNT